MEDELFIFNNFRAFLCLFLSNFDNLMSTIPWHTLEMESEVIEFRNMFWLGIRQSSAILFTRFICVHVTGVYVCVCVVV